jgi:YD repeat-containing protein
MDKILRKILFTALMISLLSSLSLHAQSIKTKYDKSGRKIDTLKTDNNGNQTTYDAAGRKTGSVKKDSILKILSFSM